MSSIFRVGRQLVTDVIGFSSSQGAMANARAELEAKHVQGLQGHLVVRRVAQADIQANRPPHTKAI